MGEFKLFTLGIVVVAAVGCGGRRIPNPSTGGVPGPLQLEYERTHLGAEPFSLRSAEAPATRITEIGIERTPCYGFCPTYTATIFADGRVTYMGQANVPSVGSRQGSISSEDFDQLARLLLDLRFFDLEDRYAALTTDLPTVYVSVVRSGRRKTILHFGAGRVGPPRLSLIEETIDRVLDRMTWKK